MRFTHVEAAPVVRVHTAHERVGIEAGRAVQREDLAGIGVQCEDRAALSRREDLRDVALQVEIDGGMDRLPGDRRQPRAATRLPHHLIQRAHLDKAHAVRAPERVVVLALQPALSQKAPEPYRGKAPLGPLRLRELPDVPH